MSLTASAMWRMRAAMTLPSLFYCTPRRRSVPAPPPDFHGGTLPTSIDAEPLEIDLWPAAGNDIRHRPPAAAGLRPAVRALPDIDEQVEDAGAPEIGRPIRRHGAQACPGADRAMLCHLRQ